MDISYSVAARTAMLQTFVTDLTGGVLHFYAGARPATSDDAVPGGATLLATMNITNGTAAAAAATLALAQAQIVATGTALWARAVKGTTVVDYDVGLAGSGAACEIEATQFVAGAYVMDTTVAITMPERVTS